MLAGATVQALLDFRRERDWEQFHSPQNLAIAISVEAGELLERFQWMRAGESRPESTQGEAVEHEIADLTILLTYLANDLGIDLNDAVIRKLRVNAERYPVEKSKGSAAKYDKL